MSFAQKDRLDRIQYTLLPTTFYRKRVKNADFRYIFWAAITYATTQYQANPDSFGVVRKLDFVAIE